ncbi:hypothetical protein [Chthoniobacter flavus]|nr:hypothetical protein [Chthoniobacter flavus]
MATNIPVNCTATSPLCSMIAELQPCFALAREITAELSRSF